MTARPRGQRHAGRGRGDALAPDRRGPLPRDGRRHPGRLRRRRPRQPGQPCHPAGGHATADGCDPDRGRWATRRRRVRRALAPQPPRPRRLRILQRSASGSRAAGRPSGRRKAASRRPRRRLCLPRHHLRGPARRARGPARTTCPGPMRPIEGDEAWHTGFRPSSMAARRFSSTRPTRSGARPRRGAGPARRDRPQLHRRLSPHRPVSRRPAADARHGRCGHGGSGRPRRHRRRTRPARRLCRRAGRRLCRSARDAGRHPGAAARTRSRSIPPRP